MTQRTYRGGGSSFQLFPAGTYPLRCHGYSDEKSNTDGSDMILLQLDVINVAKGKAHKAREYLIMREDMAWKLQKVLDAFKIEYNKVLVESRTNEEGDLEEIFDYTFDPDNFIGKIIMADITVQRRPNKKRPGEFFRNYSIEQYHELVSPDPDWPVSPWIEERESSEGGERTVTAGEISDQDTPF